MKSVIINSCDIWKTYASFRLIGVFTNRKKLNILIKKMIKNKEIEFGSFNKKVEECSIEDLQNLCNFISLEEIEFNQIN